MSGTRHPIRFVIEAELQQKELLQAIEASPRSYEEIIKFLSETEDSEEE